MHKELPNINACQKDSSVTVTAKTPVRGPPEVRYLCHYLQN